MREIRLVDCGVIEYHKAWDMQQEHFDLLQSGGGNGGTIFLCEHPHVYTLGRNGKQENLLVDERFLSQIGATFFKTDRGGDITYHGYGQLVCYPVINLQNIGLGLRDYIFMLEESVIATLSRFGIEANRSEGATGVWCGSGPSQQKICAIGVKASHFITMHGFALNINTELNYFSYINPCGLSRGVTSMKQLLGGSDVDVDAVKKAFVEEASRIFNVIIK